MLDANELIEKYRGQWYQTIHLTETAKTNGADHCGDPAWQNIKRFLPDNLKGKRILDLGCNAGIFCVRAALMGATCVGIDSNDWKKDCDYLAQAEDVKSFFENKEKTKLKIKYIKGRMEEILKNPQQLGMFDYALGIASLSYTTSPETVIDGLSRIARNVIARIRDINNRIAQLENLFDKFGFEMKRMRRENWSFVLGKPTDDFYLYEYENSLLQAA